MVNNEMNKEEQEILRRRLKERRLFLNMTYQNLAEKTGISKSTLQRYETGGIKKLPYDKIFALSDALEVNPEYFTDLSKDYSATASYNNTTKNQINRSSFIENIKKFEARAFNQITPILISQGYKVEKSDLRSLGDIVAKKGKEVWHLDFLYTSNDSTQNGEFRLRERFYGRYGRVAIYNRPITKYSFVVESDFLVEHIIEFKPIHLNIEVSIILLQESGFEEIIIN